jgi:hypothetical protein
MMTNEQVASVYDTLLCIPGMNDQIKLDLKISRRLVLLLTQVIEKGLSSEFENPTGMLAVAKQDGEELKSVVKDCLQKAGLVELSGKLDALASK